MINNKECEKKNSEEKREILFFNTSFSSSFRCHIFICPSSSQKKMNLQIDYMITLPPLQSDSDITEHLKGLSHAEAHTTFRHWFMMSQVTNNEPAVLVLIKHTLSLSTPLLPFQPDFFSKILVIILMFNHGANPKPSEAFTLLLADERVDVNYLQSFDDLNQQEHRMSIFAGEIIFGHLDIVEHMIIHKWHQINWNEKVTLNGALTLEETAHERAKDLDAKRNREADTLIYDEDEQKNRWWLYHRIRESKIDLFSSRHKLISGIFAPTMGHILARELFAATVFLCDDYFNLVAIIPTATTTTTTNNHPPSSSSSSSSHRPLSSLPHRSMRSPTTSSDLKRFFTIAMRLPMELQMVLCNRVYGFSQNNITTKQSTPCFRSVLAQITIGPFTKT